ncbi:MAG: long-chain fatty acid--CoA ligase, partial [Acidimicrobiales bacterium]
PVPGVSVRIADDGEILLKGGSIFRGYHQAEEATRAVLDAGGWLRTGDVGHLDDGGFLRITDRKKEIIVTSGGKNVAPAPLEARLRAHPLVSQSVVIGDGQPFIAALLTLDPDAFAGWAAANGRAGAALTELAADPALMAEIQRAVDDANAGVSKAESIRAFRILPHDFEVGEELSQKMSVKRHVVSEKYRHVTEEIYKGSSS